MIQEADMPTKRATTFVLLFLAAIPITTDPANAQCSTGPKPVDIVIHRAESLDDPEGWFMGAPEMFLEVDVNGHAECGLLGFGRGSSRKLQGPLKCTVMVDPPYDPIQVTIRLKEDDSELGITDDDLDIGGDAGDLTLDLEYDPGCLRVRGITPNDVPGCFGAFGTLPDDCSGDALNSQGNGGGDGRGRLSYSIKPADDCSALVDDLNLTGLEVIQVTPNPDALIAERPTMVRVNVCNNYETAVAPLVKVTLLDKNGNTFEESKVVNLDACESAQKINFFESGVLPELGLLNNLIVTAEIDPFLEIDCQTVECKLDDCRRRNNVSASSTTPLVAARPLAFLFQPLNAIDSDCTSFIADAVDLNTTAAQSVSVMQEIFPTRVIDTEVSDEYMIGFPRHVPLICPHTRLITFDLAYRLARVNGLPADRVIGIGKDDYFGCNLIDVPFIDDCHDRGGFSAGQYGRHGVVAESDAVLTDSDTVVHELGHSYDLSEAPCAIGWPASMFECEDEYNFCPDGAGGQCPTTTGISTRGYRFADNSDQQGSSCIMGGTSPGPLNAWIDDVDYDTMLDHLAGVSDESSLFVRMHLDLLPVTGSFYADETSSVTLVPDLLPASRGGAAYGMGSTSLVFRNLGGVELDTIDFTPETIDEMCNAGFGSPEGWEYLYGSGEEVDVALVVPLPADTATIDLERRACVSPPGVPTPVLVDTLVLLSEPITADLIYPTIPVPVGPGDAVPIRWGSSLLPPFTGGESTLLASPTSATILVSPNNGATWIPIAHGVRENDYLWESRSTGRYMVRVFVTNGFDTSEAEGLVDFDFDGCPDVTDPDPQFPDADFLDGDGVADICDNCPTIPNPVQEDQDDDSIGSACDNCPEFANLDQFDGDSDGSGDVCDCDPQDGGAFSVPGPAGGLALAKNAVNPDTDLDMVWDSLAPTAGSGTAYDVIAGKLTGMAGNGLVPDDCPGNDLPSPGETFSRSLSPGEGVWYVVRGQNSCGDGSWDGGGTGQVEPREGDLAGLCP
jgi:hypothetical protein